MKALKPILRMLLSPWTIMIVLALGIGAAYYMNAESRDDDNNEAANAWNQRRVPVYVSEVDTTTLRETVRGIGTLRAMALVDIRPETAGRIVAIEFEEGSEVSEGQVLFRLDGSKLQRQLNAREAALRSARATLNNAESTYGRVARLRNEGGATADEYDRARTEFEASESRVQELEAEVELVREQLEDMVLYAPFDGVISEKLADPGSFVQVGEHLATVYRSDPIEIRFHVPERYLGRIARGQDVEVLIAAYPDEVFAGAVHFISPAVREGTRDVLVRARIPNPDGILSPGAFATARLIVDERHDRAVVPEEALVATRDGYMVYVVNDETAARRPVRTGLREAGLVEITEGLQPGERIVRSGHMQLNDGDAVNIVNDEGDEAEAASETAPGDENAGEAAS